MRTPLIILFHLWVIASFGQNTIGLPKIINYSKTDFQAGTQTWDIKQDSRGIMYFANNEGMLTYDGSHWKVYPLPNRTIVRALAIDGDDRIYVGAQDEIGFFVSGPNGNLEYTSLKNLIPKQQNKFADIWRIEVFKESVFFLASDRILELRNNSIKVYSTTSEWIFLKKVGDRLFAQDKSNGLLLFSNNEWSPVLHNKQFDNIIISGLIPVGNDSILITTQCRGLYILHDNTVTQTKAHVLPESCTYVSAKINAKEFVAGTTSDGCLVMDFNGRIVQKLSRTEGLQNNNVLCVFLDKDNNLWAGLKNGISFIAYNAAIKYISPSKINELSGYSTRIYNNQLYVATSDGAYYVPLSQTTGDLSFSMGDFNRVKNSAGEVWRLDEVNRQILMGQHSGSFVIQDNTSIPLARGAGAWIFVPTSFVFPASHILVGTYNGLNLLDFSQNKFLFAEKLEGLQESLRFLAIDNNNTIWGSHPYRGVYKLQLSPDNKKISSKLYTDSAGLPSALGNYVFKIKNRVVFGTMSGVYEFDVQTERFVKSSFLTPVFGDMEIRYLTEDAAGNIWFCSGKKIGVVNYFSAREEKPFAITWFPELNGQILLGFENIYPFNKENVFIGSEKGMIHLNYEKYTANKTVIKVLLGQVKAFGRSDSIIFGGHYQPEATQEVLQLPKSYNSFHFEYSTPSYGLQNNIEYSYQLEGYDPKWSAWSSRTEKDYTNLPDGEYTFNIKAHDNLGHESDTISYAFIVKPAWYKTIWAYMVYALLFLLLLYVLDKWGKRNLHLQQMKFDEEQKRLKYIHQLELDKNEKEIITLQNEKLANEINFKNKALADASLHLVERGDALGKVKDILQTLYKKTGNNNDIKSALLLLNDAEKNNDNWDQFASHFDEINNNFLNKLKIKYPLLSSTDLKVCAYLQLQLSSKEIAQLMAISVRGVEIRRYRLRKKLHLPTEQTLNDFLNTV
ncbi:transcriptional regulator [Chitinophaga sp. SYP-B3965]|uniref:triple tyrosine motif-containing protein n=1 Tax=Chitinophaga sp. SYP-B3965 TaxID=2663120 RepID=UPI001299EAB5|nr:triple tyrosine motif-containing protein [Chitinophaga sp. SYP-B3965]MRG44980.1 transcriptional regulator [Chitinophaga sp. SYP-B3965]